jgi:hypothetical protein
MISILKWRYPHSQNLTSTIIYKCRINLGKVNHQEFFPFLDVYQGVTQPNEKA